MKARINYKSRQTIIIMSIAVVLLIAVITGTVAFVKGNRNVAAAMKNENRQTVENSEDNSKTNTSIADNGNLNNNETENNNNGNVLPNTGENADSVDIGQNGNNGENNGATIENDGNTSTSTTTGEANVPNQEYTQTTVIPGRENVLVEQNTEIGWSPINIRAFDIATKLKVHVNKFPDISTIKTSEGKHKDGTPVTKENPLHELDTITYTLAVKNIGNGKGIVKISDTVPEGTTLVADSIKCGENTYTEAELNAGIEVSLEGGEEKYITFTVTINPFKDEKITVRNAEAKQDETPVPPTDDEVVKEYVSIDVNKEFVDKENVEELRPTDVVVALYKSENDETYIDTRTLNEQNGWKESFIGLDKYDFDTKELINYDVRELDINENYTASYDKKQEQNNITLKITNTLKYEDISTSLTVNKIWIDPENMVRPEITINLHQNGSDDVFASYTLKNGETSHEFTNLPKYDADGNEYVYTTEEAEINGYTPEYSNDTLTITNTIEQENTVSISGTKTWIAPEGIEHPTITLNLIRDDITNVGTIKLSNGTTSYQFKDLDKYAPDGHIYNYTIVEENVEGYTPSYSGEYNENITNTIKQEKIAVNGEKKWIAPVGTTFPTITINLLQDGKQIVSKELPNGTTSYLFDELDRYDLTDGHEYVYTVTENKVEGYKSEQNGNNFINTIEQDNTVVVGGNKTWITPAGITHPTVTIKLLKNGEEFNTTTIENGNTTYEFTGLPMYKTDTNGNYILDDKGNVELNEYTVEEVSIDGYTSTQNGFDFVNTINQELILINGEKTWVDPEGTELVHPEITINLLKNGIKDKTIKLTNGNTKYTFTELPKYQVDEDGRYILDNNGNVQLNQYRVEEEVVQNYETSYDGYNITNTFKQDIQGTVEITTTKTSETSVKTPLDVVFVLDVSGSMNDNDKDKTMVDSVNSAISTIMQENPDSRVGVVAYSSKENSSYSNNSNAITLLPLGKYTLKSDGKYLTIKDDTYTITWRDEWGIPQSATYDKDIISTNVNEVASISLNVYGGTYTQAGIKAGADILTSASTKYTTKVNGKDKEVTRTPVIILLSDGDPTYYNKSYQSLTGDRSGTGNSTSEKDAYYTIRTADYYKKQVTSHYYGTTETKSKFYTIGLNMSGTLSKTILDPSSTNVNLCNSEGTDGTGWNKTRNVKGKLYDKIISDGSADKYSYADKSYVGPMTASDLQGIFNTIINDSTTSTDTRDITLEESNKRRVNLEGINTSKEFSLTIGSTSYNFAQAKASDYVKENDTDGYYVDLSKVAKGSTITISYNK